VAKLIRQEKDIVKAFLVIASFAALGLLSACTTRNPGEESDIPWNAPQSWEGAPSIPGMEGR